MSRYDSLASMADGTIEDWGRNDAGQLGNLSTTDSSLPVTANGLTEMNTAAGGSEHSLAASAIRRNLTTNYSYDRLYRLLGDGTTSYAYDPVGNWLSVTQGGVPTSYATDKADRLTTIGALAVATNADGDLTAITGSGVNDQFTYDQANRLVSASAPPTTATYAYDGDGNRVSMSSGGATTTYVNDTSGGLAVILSDGSRKYVWGPAGLAYSTDMSGSGALVTHADGLGSVRALTDTSGNVVATQQFDSFGNPIAAGTLGSASQPYGYAGEPADPIGLVDLRARFYAPSIGRFMSRDPLVGSLAHPQSLNRYSYAQDNPVTNVDPSGLLTFFIPGIGGSNDPTLVDFVNKLATKVQNIVGPVSAYDTPESQNAGEVVARGTGRKLDPDAQALGSRVKRDVAAGLLASGEQLNFIALSGGATVAFDTALLLQQRGITINNIVTIGGVVFRGKPGNVGKWTDIEGYFDFIDNNNVAHPDEQITLYGAAHVTSGPFPGELDADQQDEVIRDILDAGVR